MGSRWDRDGLEVGLRLDRDWIETGIWHRLFGIGLGLGFGPGFGFSLGLSRRHWFAEIWRCFIGIPFRSTGGCPQLESFGIGLKFFEFGRNLLEFSRVCRNLLEFSRVCRVLSGKSLRLSLESFGFGLE